MSEGWTDWTAEYDLASGDAGQGRTSAGGVPPRPSCKPSLDPQAHKNKQTKPRDGGTCR